MFELTKGQKELVHEIVSWYSNDMDEDFVYSGPAGTGKTTVIPYIIDELGLDSDEVLYVAFTGKASSVLMQKGFDACTIHSAFFDLKEFPVRKDGHIVTKNGRPVTKFKFVEKDSISPRIKLIVIDEWSMVSEEFMNVIYKFGIPVIASGDKYQLRPVFGECPFADKIKYNLTEITRQAKNSGIIELATLIRNGEPLPKYCKFRKEARVLSKEYLKDKHLLDADIILTAKNRTRNDFNDRVRKLHKHSGKLPEVGDKLINRKNDWTKTLDGIPLVNGIIGKCIHPIRMDECNLSRGIYRMDFQPDYIDDDYEYYEALKCDYNFLNERCGEKEIDLFNDGAKIEYAEAITVHLAQGSQYGNVLYWDEWVGDRSFMQQIRYTAVTRAVNNITMFI